jgi:hypothetical protein
MEIKYLVYIGNLDGYTETVILNDTFVNHLGATLDLLPKGMVHTDPTDLMDNKPYAVICPIVGEDDWGAETFFQ